MQFSTIFTALLATLAVASPIARPNTDASAVDVAEIDYVDDYAVEARAPPKNKGPEITETKEYAAVKKAMGTVTDGEYYAIPIVWALGSMPANKDKKAEAEMKALRAQLGFDHIGVVVGYVKETTTGKGDKAKTKKDFIGVMYDMGKKSDGTTTSDFTNYKAGSGATTSLRAGKKTTSAKAGAAKKAGADYVKSNPAYKVNGNNCNDYYKNVYGKM